MPEEKPYKGKEQFASSVQKAGYDKLSNNSKQFVDKLVQKFGPDKLVFTSGYREGEGESHHHKGDALDIRPHPEIWDYLVNEVEGLQLMTTHGFNILDESDPEMLKKTKGTGAHFHIGKDNSESVVNTAERLKQKQAEMESLAKKSGNYGLKKYDGRQVEVKRVENIKPFVQLYSENTGTTFDYTKPVSYSDTKAVDNIVASRSNGSTSNQTNSYHPSQYSAEEHYEGDGHDHGEEEGVDNEEIETLRAENLAMKTRLEEEAEILRQEKEQTEAEKALKAEEDAYLAAQQAEMDRRENYVMGEMRMAQERDAEEGPQITPQQQRSQVPSLDLLGDIQTPNFIYSLDQMDNNI